ncbi:Pectin_lyase fold/virulence factor [Hexamita inflata]|uniref:Pectin lyase fold/virulence factor n=1 Tax=Hexamita inflata TaxID=28002 RepID=A0AA86URR9_9EUKA|nr:Pectin lyase fold/virulence factor [Hexamita inflata]
MICNKKAYISSFEIASVTNSITGASFSTGYVFAQTQNIKNAFIDIADNVYSSQVSPLFQNQVQYYNIKIQIGNQYISQSLTILTINSNIIVDQMIILSATTKSIRVDTNSQLTLLQRTSNLTLAKNIEIKLQFMQGNLGLICEQTGQMKIQNYVIKGFYQTQGYIAFAMFDAYNCNIYFSNIIFKPIFLNFGNQSSYFISKVNNSIIEFSKIEIDIVNQVINLTSTFGMYFQYSGFITQLNHSEFTLSELYYISVSQIITQYINNSGQIIGQSNSNVQILLQRICFNEKLTAQQTIFDSFGLCGQIQGNISILRVSYNYIIDNVSLKAFGIVGNITQSSIFTEVSNVQIQVNIQNETSSLSVSAVFGIVQSIQWKILNIEVQSSQLSANNGSSGYICGNSLNYGEIIQVVTNSSNISSYSNAGSIVGKSSSLFLENIFVNNITIQSQQYSGGILGYVYKVDAVQCSVNNSRIFSAQKSSGLAAYSIYGISQKILIINNKIMSIRSSGMYSEILYMSLVEYSSVINCTITNNQSSNCYLGGIASTIGNNAGKVKSTQICNCTFLVILSTSSFSIGGLIGSSRGKIEISDILIENISMMCTGQSYVYIAGLVALTDIAATATNCTVQKCNFTASTSDMTFMGSFFAQSSNATIKYSLIANNILSSNAQNGSQVGGIVSVIKVLNIICSQVQSVSINYSEAKNCAISINVAKFYTYSSSTVTTVNSGSQGQNFINGIQQLNCDVFTSIISQTGC